MRRGGRPRGAAGGRGAGGFPRSPGRRCRPAATRGRAGRGRRAGRRGVRGRAGCSASAWPPPGGSAVRWTSSTPLVRGHATPPRAGCCGALAAATLASVHRQLGRHDVAQGYDETALEGSRRRRGGGLRRAASGWPPTPWGWATSRPPRATWPRLPRWPADHPSWWRQRVRLGWVRAEVALLDGRPARPRRGRASESVDLAEQSGAPRHVAKGLLFHGVALVEAGRPTRPPPSCAAPGCWPRAWARCRCCGRSGRSWGPCWPRTAPRRASRRSRPPGGPSTLDRRRPARDRCGPTGSPAPDVDGAPDRLRAAWVRSRPDGSGSGRIRCR